MTRYQQMNISKKKYLITYVLVAFVLMGVMVFVMPQLLNLAPSEIGGRQVRIHDGRTFPVQCITHPEKNIYTIKYSNTSALNLQ